MIAAAPRRLTPEQRAMAEANRGLAGVAAKGFRVGVLSFEEMVAAGFLGICRAALLYDPARGYAFTTYATAAARGEILAELKRIGRAKDRMIRESTRDPEVLAEVVADRHDADAGIDGPELLRRLREAIDRLPRRERDIIEGRLRRETLADIGDRLGVTKERVRQLERQARRRLAGMVRGGGA